MSLCDCDICALPPTGGLCRTEIIGESFTDLYVAKSGITGAGLGVYVKSDIKSRTILGNMGGTILCFKCYSDLYVVSKRRVCSYVVCVDPLEDVENTYYIDASSSQSQMRYINHMAEGKCNVQFVSYGVCQGGCVCVDVVACKDINSGTELFGNYMKRWRK